MGHTIISTARIYSSSLISEIWFLLSWYMVSLFPSLSIISSSFLLLLLDHHSSLLLQKSILWGSFYFSILSLSFHLVTFRSLEDLFIPNFIIILDNLKTQRMDNLYSRLTHSSLTPFTPKNEHTIAPITLVFLRFGNFSPFPVIIQFLS